MRKQKPCHCHKPAPLCDCPNNWAHCRECKKPITWVKTQSDKNMPIDGHHRFAHYDKEHQTPHWGTCPARKPKPSNPNKLVAVATLEPTQLNIFAESAIQEIRALRTRQQGGQSWQ